MHMVTRSLILFLVLLSLVSCNKALKPEVLPPNISLGATYYTQFVIGYEKETHLTTNYRRGSVIPVNTPVKLLNITSKTIEVEVDNSSQKLMVKNVEKHTGDNVYQAFDKLFALQKVNLSKFTELELIHIKTGSVANGMSKDAVIIAIGYPPITGTMNLESNRWVYWSGRYNKFNVHFKNGKVSMIELNAKANDRTCLVLLKI